eukprot:TRINITY_DN8375_c0_g1_i3.p1 TRINITY_DN8375_c0_g1~~TRINITY_DN8375_c0_g1_i3.p1  ORF type:complete len:201 (+),score=41.92 TRINITY_DN8375_c0_g1_i3:19-621(+)
MKHWGLRSAVALRQGTNAHSHCGGFAAAGATPKLFGSSLPPSCAFTTTPFTRSLNTSTNDNKNNAEPIKRGPYDSIYRHEEPAEEVKESTEWVGLEVVPNAREVLIALYEKTLVELSTLPKGQGYRSIAEKVTRDRMKVVKDNKKISEIEDIVDCGPVEMMIEHAQDELELIEVVRANPDWFDEKDPYSSIYYIEKPQRY